MAMYAVCQTLILMSAAAWILIYRKFGDPMLFRARTVRTVIISLTGVIINAVIYYG